MPRPSWRRLATVAAACALLTPLGVASADSVDLGRSSDHVTPPEFSARFATTGKWFVELESEPTASGGSAATVDAEQEKFLRAADRESIPLTVNSRYESLFNGLAVESDAEGAAALAELPGVVAVYPVFPVERPAPQETATPDLAHAVAMTGADVVGSELGFDGAGIRVGIIDSGIDIDHPDLGGSGTNGETDFPTSRVTHGWDFVGDDYNASFTSPDYQPVPNPDPVPDDCGGHGTHVAGIVGASGDVDGVAPGVTLGAYRVFGCEGSTDTQIILDALEMALADGMDVVNMSLGAAFQSWPQYPTGVAANRLVDAGVVVVASAGNEGDYFTQAVGSPSAGEKVISVASYDNTFLTLDELLVTDADDETASVGYLSAEGSPALDDSVDGLELVWTTDELGCEAEEADLTGTIAVTWRGTCSFHEKAANAQAAGAEALIIANNEPGVINATVAGETEITIPVVTVLESDGEVLAGMTEDADGAPTAVVTGEVTEQPNPTAGLVSDFSSWGLAADLSLRPDLGAPGGSIYSTYPVEEGGYFSNSGTSMAAPHVAGAVALMLQADPDLTPAEVLAQLQNTAMPSLFSLEPDLGLLDAAHHQGAGLIRVDRAILGEVTVSPGKISAGESADGPHTEVLTLTNDSETDVTYEVAAVDAVGTYVDAEDPEATQNTPSFALWESDVTLSAESVTVPAGGSAEVTVTIDADPEAFEGAIYSGFVVFSPAEGGDPLSVPFAGMAGDYGNVDMLPDAGMNLPTLVVVEECDFWNEQQCVDAEPVFDYAPDGYNYRLGRDLPTVALHLAVPALRVEVEVLAVGDDGTADEDSARLAYAVDLVGRDPGLSLWSWDGRLADDSGLVSEVDPGQYAMRITAHEPDGDGGTQSWTSPAFGVKDAPEPTPTPTPTVTPTVAPTPTPTVAPTPPAAAGDLYTTPGYHHVNGRDWFTMCEPYSQTVRCRTSILATTVTQDGDRFIVQTGWAFNNLTYVASPRQLWVNNPLGNRGEWVAADGRPWRTDCDSAATGRGGCRSYALVKVIEAAPGGGYRWVEKWIFNNMVRFSN